jgi:N utilization substance protein B
MPENDIVIAWTEKIKVFNRKKTRKLLFQKLYASSFIAQDDLEFDNTFYAEVFHFDIDVKYLEEMISLIHEKEWYLLKIIWLLAPKFKIRSMGLSFVLPVYIWACEMLYLTEEIPAKVSLNEAVEMAKVYWDESSKKIVNGVMNKLYKSLDSIQKDLEEFDWDFWFKLLKK